MTETLEPTIYEKAFAKSDKTDAILVIDGKKLHVNKALLSYHSEYFNKLFNQVVDGKKLHVNKSVFSSYFDYFKALFNSDTKEKPTEEILIEDVKFEDFATLLSLVHDKPHEINKNNAVNLLRLADRFLLNAPKYIVVNLIKASSEFDQYEKQMWADKYLYRAKRTLLDFYFEIENGYL